MKLNEAAGLVFQRADYKRLNSSVETDQDALRLLSAIDGRKTLAEIADSLDIELKEAAMAVLKLQYHQLVELPKRQTHTRVVLGPRFMDFIVEQYTKAVGPLARVLVEDVAQEMGYAYDRVPKQRALQFIGKLGLLIPEDDKRRVFESSVSVHLK